MPPVEISSPCKILYNQLKKLMGVSQRTGCFMTFKLVSSALGIAAGLSVFFIFTFHYQNVEAGVWALISAIFAATVLHLYLMYRNFKLDSWHTPKSLNVLKMLSLFGLIASTIGIWYVTYEYPYEIDERCPVQQRRRGVQCPSTEKRVPPQNSSVIRVVCLSDTHGAHNDFEIPSGDILIFGGDFLNVSSKDWMNQTFEFDKWLNMKPHRHKIFVPGNHDTVLDHSLRLVEKGLVTTPVWLNNAKVLINDTVTVEGITVSGLPHTWLPPQIPATKEKKETFPFFVDFDSELTELLQKMPATDILVTHNPPWQVGGFKWPYDYGSKAILKHVMDTKPKLHMFGHVHEGRGLYARQDSKTVFINTGYEKRGIAPFAVVDFNKETKDIAGVYMPISYHDQFI